ncbi:MAG TPA: MBOAT family O-acyltransferase [Gemmataceae bacterium]|nr:MBOAT family O-acyltransferase [Gemmataceae bacterium]
MLFCTQQFLFFFVIVFSAYWAIPWVRPRVWLLLAASYYFYSSWNADLARLIFLTTVCDFFIARGMDATAVPWRRRALLLLSIVGNLSVLCYFKYANFFLDSLRTALTAAGAQSSLPVLNVVLPIGISFYTFEAISYTVDVYRGRIRAERRLDHFLLFILFFPHLVAGPIVRARDFLPQVYRPKCLTWPRMAVGGRLILLGVFKKLAIADRMALLADPVFVDPGRFESGVVWLAAVAYAIQVYCDFSGYSDIALGTARLLGYRLAVNFNLPFAAVNMADLWRRWHISLSTWIRDYVFFPLGGSRGSEWRTAFNLLLAMTLCGLWHGAAWTFVAWGTLNGVFLLVHRHFAAWADDKAALRSALDSGPGTFARVALTFLTFTLGVVVFRSPSFHSALTFLGRLFAPAGGEGSPVPVVTFWAIAAIVAAGHVIGSGWPGAALANRFPAPVRGLAYASVLFLALVLAPVNGKVFVYFQF